MRPICSLLVLNKSAERELLDVILHTCFWDISVTVGIFIILMGHMCFVSAERVKKENLVGSLYPNTSPLKIDHTLQKEIVRIIIMIIIKIPINGCIRKIILCKWKKMHITKEILICTWENTENSVWFHI